MHANKIHAMRGNVNLDCFLDFNLSLTFAA